MVNVKANIISYFNTKDMSWRIVKNPKHALGLLHYFRRLFKRQPSQFIAEFLRSGDKAIIPLIHFNHSNTEENYP